jgi:hypothetical protein
MGDPLLYSSNVLDPAALSYAPLGESAACLPVSALDGGSSAVTSGPTSDAASPPSDATSTLITHLARWLAWNFDASENKADLHVDQTYDHFTGSTNVMQLDIGVEASCAFKCQLHAVQFTTSIALDALIGLFDGFAGLNDPSVAGCTKLSTTPTLTLMDEYRWRIPLPSELVSAVSAALTFALTAALPGEGLTAFPAIKAIFGLIAERRFDIRVIGLEPPTTLLAQFTLTVQTLADHPYGARRAWRVRPTGVTINAQPEYRLETVEFNSYSWLPDYLGEKYGGTQTQLTWEKFLNQYVTVAAGTITDSTLLKGKTVTKLGSSRADSLNMLLSDPLMLQIISDYPTLVLEVDRQKSALSEAAPQNTAQGLPHG